MIEAAAFVAHYPQEIRWFLHVTVLRARAWLGL